MAPNFVVEGTHRLALQVQVKIHIKLAIATGIAPDRCRRRFRTTAGITKQLHHMRLIEPDQPVEASRLRWWCNLRRGLGWALFRQRRSLSRGPRWQVGQDRRMCRGLARRWRWQRRFRLRLTRCNRRCRPRRWFEIAGGNQQAQNEGDRKRRIWSSNHVHGLRHLTLPDGLSPSVSWPQLWSI
jgi:hypothetical protein